MLWNFERFDINHSLWVKQAFEAKKYAFAADFIRLYAVYHFGGIYLDMDIEVVKPFDDLLNSEIMIGYEDGETKKIEAGCFGAIIGNCFIEQCLNYYKEREFIKADGSYDILPLPNIITEIYNKNCLEKYKIYTSDYFTAKSFSTGITNPTFNTYSIHHFAGSWHSVNESKKHEIRHKIFSLLGDNNFSKFIIWAYWLRGVIVNIVIRFFVKLGPIGTIKHYYRKIFKKR